MVGMYQATYSTYHFDGHAQSPTSHMLSSLSVLKDLVVDGTPTFNMLKRADLLLEEAHAKRAFIEAVLSPSASPAVKARAPLRRTVLVCESLQYHLSRHPTDFGSDETGFNSRLGSYTLALGLWPCEDTSKLLARVTKEDLAPQGRDDDSNRLAELFAAVVECRDRRVQYFAATPPGTLD